MSKKILSVALALVATLTMTAQTVDKSKVTTNADAAAKAGDALRGLESGEKAWKFDGTVGLNAAATGLVNWAAGGKNNVNGIAYAKLHLLYHKNAIAWETNFDTDFGMTWIQQKDDAFQKSSDNIKLATKFGWEFKPTWYLTVLAGFQSQYALGRNYDGGPAYNNIISKWLAPSYTDVSVGIDWKKSYNGADFSIYLSPIAGRITTAYVGNAWDKKYTAEYIAANPTETGYVFSEDLKDRYGVSYYATDGVTKMYDRNARAEFGLSFKGSIAYTYQDFKIGTTLALFTPYAGKGHALASYEDAATREAHREADPTYNVADHYFQYSNMNRHFGMFDVDWNVMLSYQFLKCLQITLQTDLKYYPGTLIANGDGVEAERVQFKGVIGLGVGYSF